MIDFRYWQDKPNNSGSTRAHVLLFLLGDMEDPFLDSDDSENSVSTSAVNLLTDNDVRHLPTQIWDPTTIYSKKMLCSWPNGHQVYLKGKNLGMSASCTKVSCLNTHLSKTCDFFSSMDRLLDGSIQHRF